VLQMRKFQLEWPKHQCKLDAYVDLRTTDSLWTVFMDNISITENRVKGTGTPTRVTFSTNNTRSKSKTYNLHIGG